MSLLTLKDIGKIYVSEGNVSVGIRGVNLSFDKGEFVAVTGKSGSGKSTLLNVISGMDSYEEGELFIEGQPTSHYLQKEWEEYREKYISFIFQDYNIIESFTVLQNVELSLMHIEDKKERRRRALELLDRVGMTSHIKQKGSKLSGGQKQRTVIARALAKDSPIILADEPTGNLDSATSEEIIELLHEVSRDKLLIVVTHNFEQVEKCATRHIRVFDGAVESDHVISRSEISCKETEVKENTANKKKNSDFKKGLTLGRAIFTSKPKLSFFLCLLMLIGTLGIFMVTTLCGDASILFEKNYMFEHIDGRVVITTQNGAVISEEELENIVNKYGAKDYLHYDILLDSYSYYMNFKYQGEDKYVEFAYTYGEDFGDDIIGRYPEKNNEVLLYMPISYQPMFGKNSIEIKNISYSGMELNVTGIKYYYDNNITPRCLFTSEGFRTVTALHYIFTRSSTNISVRIFASEGYLINEIQLYNVIPSFDMEDGTAYINSGEYTKFVNTLYDKNCKTQINFTAQYYNYDYNNYETSQKAFSFVRLIEDENIVDNGPVINGYAGEYDGSVFMSVSLLREISEEVLERAYRQASIFFENDKEARIAAEKLKNDGYIAVTSDTTYTPDATTVIIGLIAGLMVAFMWFIAIVFLAFFIGLCSNRTIGAFKGDMAIMRSMGIPVKVIKTGMYVRMLIALIPAYILVIATAVLIFTTPKFNEFFTYLYAWEYAVIFVGMLILTLRITRGQVKRLFGESVKKSLKGGAAE
ncbi:MAG: ATP-binding cassette domain-containing protein [Ruminococcaceae bacterium]|nr:ATP-binding cassette domain-containing protein [Oscillospiraceae bacterium]